MDVVTISNGLKFFVESKIEQYRCDTFFTKEPETLLWIETYLEGSRVFYDIGANVGLYTMYAAMKHPECTVYAFEPFLPNYTRLVENVRLNGLDNVIPLYCALSDAPGIERLYIRDDEVGASGHQITKPVDEWGNGYEAKGVLHVISERLDGLIERYSLPVANNVKIDVDGVEERIIDGMVGLIGQEDLNSVLIEVNHSTTNYTRIKGLFEDNGFTVENEINSSPEHSRFRRAKTRYKDVENVVFSRPNTRG